MKYRPSAKGTEIVREDYRKKVIFSQDDFEEKGHLLQVVTIPPNTRQRMHFHDQQTEVFYILVGEATITISDMDYPARSGDAFICSPGGETSAAASETMPPRERWDARSVPLQLKLTHDIILSLNRNHR